jgi:hypothetical protein
MSTNNPTPQQYLGTVNADIFRGYGSETCLFQRYKTDGGVTKVTIALMQPHGWNKLQDSEGNWRSMVNGQGDPIYSRDNWPEEWEYEFEEHEDLNLSLKLSAIGRG